MLGGTDMELDPIGLFRQEEFVCGSCMHTMITLSSGRYQCPHCGMVFYDVSDWGSA